jgi:hypothetical protein
LLRKKVKFSTKSVAVYPSYKDLLHIGFILDKSIAKPLDITPDYRYQNFAAILQEFQNTTPTTINELKKIVQQQFNWTFFEFPKGKSLHEHLWRVRSFFQSLHSIGIGYIEGNHRAVLACKLLYGTKVNATYPLKLPFGKLDSTTPKRKKKQLEPTPERQTRLKEEEEIKLVPQQSPLHYTSLDVKTIIPCMDKTNPDETLLTSAELAACRERSMGIAKHKQLVLKEDWNTFMLTTLDTLAGDPTFKPVTVEQFLRIKLPKSMKGWNTSSYLFDRRQLPYVDMAYKSVETIMDALFKVEPAATISKSYKKDMLKGFLKLKQQR